MTGKTFKRGDAVAWTHSQGTSKGKVLREQTSPTRIKGHKVAASPDDPQYIVKSEKTGAVAAHRPGALRQA